MHTHTLILNTALSKQTDEAKGGKKHTKTTIKTIIHRIFHFLDFDGAIVFESILSFFFVVVV